MLLLALFFPSLVSSSEIPLAPYNVKVFCRQGLRFTRLSQTAQQCPSSATACGYLEYSFPNKTDIESTGIFDCVDSGMLKDDEPHEEGEYSDEPPGSVLFSQLCGAQASCSTLGMDQLNPAFSRYLVMQHGVKMEELQDSKLRFCCSLFHATLQKLIISGTDRLPSASASSMHCGGESCTAGAVGCLSHSSGSSDSEEYEDKLLRRRRREENEEEDYGINAVEVSFDDEETSLVLVSREPSTTAFPPNRTGHFLPSLNLPLMLPKVLPSKVKNGVKYAIIDEDDEDDEAEEEMHCVYRHLNDELYRWCLFVHQSKMGDRCYHHQGHTVCCCFAPPDMDTCDPTEMELVIPGRTAERPHPIKVTPRPSFERITTSTTPSASTTTSTTTTTTTPASTTTSTATTTTTSATTIPPTTTPPRCRVTYTKTKGRRTPVLVCGSSSFPAFLFLLVTIFMSS